MKFSVITMACLAGTAVARMVNYQTCTSMGDPHYKGFSGKHPMVQQGHRNQGVFTIMGEGEFVLAREGNFSVSACSQDVTKGRKSKKLLTWNRDWQITNDGIMVKMDGGETQEYKLDITGSEAFTTVNLGDHADKNNFKCDASAKGQICRKFMKNEDVEVVLMRSQISRSSYGRGNRVVVKFPKVNKMLIANILSKTSRTVTYDPVLQADGSWKRQRGIRINKFGKRTHWVLYIKVPRVLEAPIGWGYLLPGPQHNPCDPRDTRCIEAWRHKAKPYEGLCAETKKSIRGHLTTNFAKFTDNKLSCNRKTPAGQVEAKPTDELVTEIIADPDVAPCDEAVRSAAVEQCTGVNQVDFTGCVLDKLEDCDADGIDDLLTTEMNQIAYTCPTNSYISTSSWPLVSFDDCDCLWGHDRHDSEETCTPRVNERYDRVLKKWTILMPSTTKACFCDGTAPHHCFHNNVGDGSCGLPVWKADGTTQVNGKPVTHKAGTECNDPVKAVSAECVCSSGTTDCGGTGYFLRMKQQPAMAAPGTAFGQQPTVELVDGAGNIVQDSDTYVRVSLANAQDENCACGEDTPCLHDNIGDNTCHSKYKLFGDLVCPAGTTECLPKQATTKLYQNQAGQNSKDPKSLFAKTTQCRMRPATLPAAGNRFCSGLTPCKHQADGSCVQKTAFYSQKVEAAPVKKETCKGTVFWRRAVPSPVRSWFFETDTTCDMDTSDKLGTKLGCTSPDHSYAMDKWCDVNCHPKHPGQPPFCPPSHCDCSKEAAPAVTPETAEWACPADRLDDGSCRCAAGTEYCGAIDVKLNNGVATFEHLTIGTEGRYQLSVEVVMPDQNTGSNNVQVSTQTGVFDVVLPKTRGKTCRAQASWRKPKMYKSEAHGEGQAWFYEDSKKCLSHSADGKCQAVDTKTEYAMDKWCKANACAAHTLKDHCEFYSPAADSPDRVCSSAKYDMFGDCCTADHVDACGVCGGDGSSCHVQSYIAEPVQISGATDVIFNASLAHPSCDMKNPCMHLNDMTCLPKTINSADPTKIGEDHHAYWDRKATAAEQPNWKFGTWAVEGQISGSIKRMYEDGNKDCYCSAGTIDISKKIAVEEKAKEDFIAALIKQVADESDASATTPTEKVTLENSIGVPTGSGPTRTGAAQIFDGPGCTGQKSTLTSVYKNVMCGTHWDGSGAKGNCNSPKDTKCCNDAVRSIMLPAMTTAKLFKHCNNKNQERYPSIENFDTECKCFELPADNFDTSMIEMEGNVLKVDAKVVGTQADCFESQCYNYVEACQKDAACAEILSAAEELTANGDTFLASLKINSDLNVALKSFTDLFTCVGLAQPQCDPTKAVSPVTVSTTPTTDDQGVAIPTVVGTPASLVDPVVKAEIKKAIPALPEVVIEVVPPAPVIVTSPPTAKPTAAPTNAATAAATLAPTKTPTKAPTASPTEAPVPVKVVNPTGFNNPVNLITPVVEQTPVIMVCQKPIRPVATSWKVTRQFRGESLMLFGRRRLAAGTATAFVQVSTSGNQGAIGSATTSPASAAQFAAGATPQSAASAGGIGAAGTALVAIGCVVGLFGALVAGVAYKRQAPKQAISNSYAAQMSTKAHAEDQADVL